MHGFEVANLAFVSYDFGAFLMRLRVRRVVALESSLVRADPTLEHFQHFPVDTEHVSHVSWFRHTKAWRWFVELWFSLYWHTWDSWCERFFVGVLVVFYVFL